MQVEVSDGRYQAQTNVQVIVKDMNDNAPVFSKRVYSVYNVVEEDNSISPSNRLPIVQVFIYILHATCLLAGHWFII